MCIFCKWDEKEEGGAAQKPLSSRKTKKKAATEKSEENASPEDFSTATDGDGNPDKTADPQSSRQAIKKNIAGDNDEKDESKEEDGQEKARRDVTDGKMNNAADNHDGEKAIEQVTDEKEEDDDNHSYRRRDC